MLLADNEEVRIYGIPLKQEDRFILSQLEQSLQTSSFRL